MTKLPNSDVKKMLDYLAWIDRTMFPDDFANSLIKVAIQKGETKSYATYLAKEIWKTYKQKGLIGMYQEYITDADTIDTIIQAINFNN